MLFLYFSITRPPPCCNFFISMVAPTSHQPNSLNIHSQFQLDTSLRSRVLICLFYRLKSSRQNDISTLWIKEKSIEKLKVLSNNLFISTDPQRSSFLAPQPAVINITEMTW